MNIEHRTFLDLSSTILHSLWKLPRDIDLVVGIPRSGMLPASLIATALNTPLVDLDGFLAGRVFKSGFRVMPSLNKIKKVLIVDDSIATGAANANLREQLDRLPEEHQMGDILLAAVYVQPDKKHLVDFYFEEVAGPRIFEWNFANHYLLPQSCVDIDGVLCRDPTEEENDDGELYRKFLLSAEPHFRFRRRIGWLVTNRLEKFRQETEEWLFNHRIEYNELIMLDLPTKQARQQNGPHGKYKAKVYNRIPASLFIESALCQSNYILEATGKPVLCTNPWGLVNPNMKQEIKGKVRRSPRSVISKFRSLARRYL